MLLSLKMFEEADEALMWQGRLYASIAAASPGGLRSRADSFQATTFSLPLLESFLHYFSCEPKLSRASP